MENPEAKRVNLELIISLVIVMATILGTTIPMYIHTDSKIQAIQNEMAQFHAEMARETKEFHGRLIALEERARK